MDLKASALKKYKDFLKSPSIGTTVDMDQDIRKPSKLRKQKKEKTDEEEKKDRLRKMIERSEKEAETKNAK